MPFFDPMLREHWTGLGCAAENMVLAARGLGLAADVTAFPDGSAGTTAAIIEIAEGESATAAEQRLASAIPRRHTNRGPFDARPIPASDLDRLDAMTVDVPRTGVAWVTGSGERDELGALYVEATETIVADREQSEESFSWLREERAELDRYRDGVTLDCQGLDPGTLFAAKVLPPQSRTDGDRYWVGSTRDVHVATAAAYGVVTVDDAADPLSMLTGGRLLQRLHLAATDRGLAFHHMNQITERIDRDGSLGAPDVFSDRWSRVIGAPASGALVSFRIGYPQREPGLSPRRPLSEVRE